MKSTCLDRNFSLATTKQFQQIATWLQTVKKTLQSFLNNNKKEQSCSTYPSLTNIC